MLKKVSYLAKIQISGVTLIRPARLVFEVKSESIEAPEVSSVDARCSNLEGQVNHRLKDYENACQCLENINKDKEVIFNRAVNIAKTMNPEFQKAIQKKNNEVLEALEKRLRSSLDKKWEACNTVVGDNRLAAFCTLSNDKLVQEMGDLAQDRSDPAALKFLIAYFGIGDLVLEVTEEGKTIIQHNYPDAKETISINMFNMHDGKALIEMKEQKELADFFKDQIKQMQTVIDGLSFKKELIGFYSYHEVCSLKKTNFNKFIKAIQKIDWLNVNASDLIKAEKALSSALQYIDKVPEFEKKLNNKIMSLFAPMLKTSLASSDDISVEGKLKLLEISITAGTGVGVTCLPANDFIIERARILVKSGNFDSALDYGGRENPTVLSEIFSTVDKGQESSILKRIYWDRVKDMGSPDLYVILRDNGILDAITEDPNGVHSPGNFYGWLKKNNAIEADKFIDSCIDDPFKLNNPSDFYHDLIANAEPDEKDRFIQSHDGLLQSKLDALMNDLGRGAAVDSRVVLKDLGMLCLSMMSHVEANIYWEKLEKLGGKRAYSYSIGEKSKVLSKYLR